MHRINSLNKLRIPSLAMSNSGNQPREETATEFQELLLNYYNLQQQIVALQTSQVSQSYENSAQFPSTSFQFQQLPSQPSQQILSSSQQPSLEIIQELLETDFTQLDLPQPTNSRIILETLLQHPNQELEGLEISNPPPGYHQN